MSQRIIACKTWMIAKMIKMQINKFLVSMRIVKAKKMVNLTLLNLKLRGEKIKEKRMFVT